jgi:hypothetical protein
MAAGACMVILVLSEVKAVRRYAMKVYGGVDV